MKMPGSFVKNKAGPAKLQAQLSFSQRKAHWFPCAPCRSNNLSFRAL